MEEVPLDENCHGWEPIFCSSLREAYYDIIDKVPNKCWKEFARTGLSIDESVIDDICHDERHNVREQKFQMCRKWGERECVDDGEVDHLEIITDTMKYLYQILNHFLLGEKYPKPERKNVSKRKRYKRNYCYRVSKVIISSYQNGGKRFLSHYETGTGSREAVLFNNTFTHSDKFVPRLGTEFDVENMKNLWKELGCNVTVHIDLTAIDMTNRLKDYAATWCDIDYCVIIIMSHGDKGDVIYGESFEAEDFVLATDIVDIFSATNTKQLAGIPKLFFFECSRGGKVGSTDFSPTNTKPDVRPFPMYEDCIWDVPVNLRRITKKHRSRSFTIDSAIKQERMSKVDEFISPDENNLHLIKECPSPNDNMPPLSDMLICFSTAPGYSSFRDPRNGSWFVNAITNVFMTHANQQHVVSLMMKVGEAMSERTASEKSVEDQKCISHFECTLRKELHLTAASATSPERLHATASQGAPARTAASSEINQDEKSVQTDHHQGGHTRHETTDNSFQEENSHQLYQTLIASLAGALISCLWMYCGEVIVGWLSN